MKERARRAVRRFEDVANTHVLSRSQFVFEGRRGLVRRSEWSIGIFQGASPVTLTGGAEATNPVLTREDVTDAPAAFVADPFLLGGSTGWTMFFEVLNTESGRGEIAVADSPDGLRWDYRQRVLVEPFHLSYPYVFSFDGDRYMIPETSDLQEVRLYVADPFPDRWVYLRTLLTGHLLDASVFRHGGHWWMYCGTSPNLRHDHLRLFYATDLHGPWHEHPDSPVVRKDPRNARPAGRVIVDGSHPIRFAQDCYRRYGHMVHAFEVIELTPMTYRERPLAREVLKPSRAAWNSVGMHTVDAHRIDAERWIAAVDGRGRPRNG